MNLPVKRDDEVEITIKIKPGKQRVRIPARRKRKKQEKLLTVLPMPLWLEVFDEWKYVFFWFPIDLLKMFIGLFRGKKSGIKPSDTCPKEKDDEQNGGV